ncbi:hypothetical protein EON65_22895 [archaeon]|nr:MAG: hypothetical protein EON65_22895 [archaeon]
MEEWLCETVGLSTERASILATSFTKAGLGSLEDFYSSPDKKKNWLNILNVEIEEWEAVSLANAITLITRGDSLVSQDPGFHKVK